jgi:Flp pilus assembly pilin Flp
MEGLGSAGTASAFRAASLFQKLSATNNTEKIMLRTLWSNDEGQDIAEYAVMLAVILVLVIGTIRLVGGNANNAFSTVASSLQ